MNEGSRSLPGVSYHCPNQNLAGKAVLFGACLDNEWKIDKYFKLNIAVQGG